MKQTYEMKMLKASDYTIRLYLDYFNERLRVDDYLGNLNAIIGVLDEVMEKNNFKKLIFFTRGEHWQHLLKKGFTLEGKIDGYFNGSDNYIMTMYKEIDRRTTIHWIEEDSILQAIQEKQRKLDDRKDQKSEGGKDQKLKDGTLPDQYQIRKAIKKDASALAQLYGTVFSVYPTPMNKRDYVAKMIDEGTVFYVVECDNQVVSAASADVNRILHHAELTDCATLAEHRKYGLMKKLLVQLENELKDMGIYCAFSIARALSFGMNAAFYQLGYHYSGRLTNNCYIFDKLEDMNIWVKDLSQ